jgi:hypothetical protein
LPALAGIRRMSSEPAAPEVRPSMPAGSMPSTDD